MGQKRQKTVSAFHNFFTVQSNTLIAFIFPLFNKDIWTWVAFLLNIFIFLLTDRIKVFSVSSAYGALMSQSNARIILSRTLTVFLLAITATFQSISERHDGHILFVILFTSSWIKVDKIVLQRMSSIKSTEPLTFSSTGANERTDSPSIVI